jgi:hypothetical protein
MQAFRHLDLPIAPMQDAPLAFHLRVLTIPRLLGANVLVKTNPYLNRMVDPYRILELG